MTGVSKSLKLGGIKGAALVPLSCCKKELFMVRGYTVRGLFNANHKKYVIIQS